MSEMTALELWQNYRFLTKEMLKFIVKQDMELVYELMDQRERLQNIIDETDDEGFKLSPLGRSLLSQIQQDNQVIFHRVQAKHLQMKQHHHVTEIYNAASASNTSASRLNWER
jgi:hypothetical protein